MNTRCDYEDEFMKKINNWQFNPPKDKPRFNPFLHSTMIKGVVPGDARGILADKLTLSKPGGQIMPT